VDCERNIKRKKALREQGRKGKEQLKGKEARLKRTKTLRQKEKQRHKTNYRMKTKEECRSFHVVDITPD
jgi:hypothetical protein